MRLLTALSACGAVLLFGQSSLHAEHFDQWINDVNICASWVRLNEGGHASIPERISACNRVIDAGATPAGILSKYPDAKASDFKGIDWQTYLDAYYLGRADAYLEMNRPRDALADLGHIRAETISDAWKPLFYASRALANDLLGNSDKIIPDVDLAEASVGPKASKPFYNTMNLRADAELQLGRYPEAISHYEQVIRDAGDLLKSLDQYAHVRENLAKARQLAANPKLASPRPR